MQVIDNYVGGRGLISEQEINGSTVSNIFVAAASLQDTGNYTCEAPALAANTSVNLHVLVDGELVVNVLMGQITFSDWQP